MLFSIKLFIFSTTSDSALEYLSPHTLDYIRYWQCVHLCESGYDKWYLTITYDYYFYFKSIFWKYKETYLWQLFLTSADNETKSGWDRIVFCFFVDYFKRHIFSNFLFIFLRDSKIHLLPSVYGTQVQDLFQNIFQSPHSVIAPHDSVVLL